jgi:hypothetical protein
VRNSTNASHTAQAIGFDLVFPDVELRQRIEALLIERNSNKDIKARYLPNEQLRLPHDRKTITDVLDGIENVKREFPDLAGHLCVLVTPGGPYFLRCAA